MHLDEPTYRCRRCFDEGSVRVLHDSTVDAIRSDREQFAAGKGYYAADVTAACDCDTGLRWHERHPFCSRLSSSLVLLPMGLDAPHGRARALLAYDAWRAGRKTWAASDFAAACEREPGDEPDAELFDAH